MSLPALSNFQLDIVEEYFHGRKTWGGAITKDKVPKTIASGKFYIVNLDNSTGPGTHWTLLFNCKPNECIYFDSYGMPPPESVVTAMLNTRKKTQTYNNVDLQELGTQTCGWWCIYVAEELLAGKSLLQTVSFADKANGKNPPDEFLTELFESSPNDRFKHKGYEAIERMLMKNDR